MGNKKRTYAKVVVSPRCARELIGVWLGDNAECELIISRNECREVEIIMYYERETPAVRNLLNCMAYWQKINRVEQ